MNLRRTIAHDFLARRQIAQLRAENEPSLSTLGGVMDDVLANRLSSEERRWIDRIENLRGELNKSSAEVTVTDFGARAPKAHLTAEEMYQGTILTSTIRDICKRYSKSYKWALLLFKIIRTFRPAACLELGTGLGVSAAFEAAALELNGHGHVTSLEGAGSLVQLARKNLQRLGLTRGTVIAGRFQETLPEVLRTHGPFGFVFIDGHHDEAATLQYFGQIHPFLLDDAVLVLDDIRWSNGMSRAWKMIRRSQGLMASIDMLELGLCLFSNAPFGRKDFQIAL